MKESDIQRDVLRWLKNRGAYTVKTMATSKNGVPDVLCCLDGRFIGLELKKPGGNERALQEYNIKKIVEAGGVAGFVRSVGDVERLLNDC